MEIEDKANMMLGHVETFKEDVSRHPNNITKQIIENLYQLRESIIKLIEEYGKECN